MCAIISVCGISQGDSQLCEMCCLLRSKVIRRCTHEGTIEKLYNHTISQISIEHYLYMLARLARSLINLTASGKKYWILVITYTWNSHSSTNDVKGKRNKNACVIRQSVRLALNLDSSIFTRHKR